MRWRLAVVVLSGGLCAVQSMASERSTASIASIDGRTFSLAEVDRAGGYTLHDLAQQLYESRVRALYQLLSEEVLRRESASRKMTPEQLIATEVSKQALPITDADVQAFLKSQPRSDASNPRSAKQAQVLIGMKRETEVKRALISTLFDKYAVRVTLDPPAPMPAEEIQGAKAPVLGDSAAPVEIVVFSDYRCRYCRELAHTLDQFLATANAAARVIYRHLPLSDTSESLAQAALCAADQGRFAEYHRRLFTPGEAPPDVSKLASELGLDTIAFETCVQTRAHAARIAEDKREARRLRIEGTPTLFVQGQRLRGAQSLEQLQFAVNQALSTAATAKNAERTP